MRSLADQKEEDEAQTKKKKPKGKNGRKQWGSQKKKEFGKSMKSRPASGGEKYALGKMVGVPGGKRTKKTRGEKQIRDTPKQ